jgi:signal transduction histidine kinase
MDGLVFALALLFILWVLGWGRIFLASPHGFLGRTMILAFPLLSVSVLGLAIYLAAGRPFQQFRGPLGWIALGLLFAFLGNLLWGIRTLQGAHVQARQVWEGLAYFIPLCRLAAPFSREDVAEFQGEESLDHRRMAILLPYLPVVPALLIGARLLVRGTGADPVPIWLAIGMVVLLLARQYRALRQVHRLSASLEKRVRARTQALEESQAMVLQVQRMNTVASLGAGLAHDLNNLISSAENYLEMVSEHAAEGRPPEPTHLEGLRLAVRQAGELTSGLMGVGHQDEPEQLEWLDLDGWLRKALPLLRALLPRGIHLECLAAGRPVMILGHRSQWNQILVNLVSNARDAMPNGGHIQVRLETSEDRAVLTVADDGIGMPPAVQARVFEPFYSTKGAGKGTGLGLASVKILLDRAGGSVALWSEPGQGSRFTLQVPLAEAPEA